MTAFTRSSNSTGKTMTFRGTDWNNPERIGTVLSGRSEISMRRFSAAHLADESFADLQAAEMPVFAVISERRQQHHAAGFFRFHLVDDALLRVHQRSEFRQQASGLRSPDRAGPATFL